MRKMKALIPLFLLLIACNSDKHINIELCNGVMHVRNELTDRNYSIKFDSTTHPQELLNDLYEARIKRISETSLEPYDTLQMTYCNSETSVNFVNAINMLKNEAYLNIKFNQVAKLRALKFREYCNGCEINYTYNHVAHIKKDTVIYCIEQCSFKNDEKKVICGNGILFYDSCYIESFDHKVGGVSSWNKRKIKSAQARNMTIEYHSNYIDSSRWQYCENRFGSESRMNFNCSDSDHGFVIDRQLKMNQVESSIAGEISKYDSIAEFKGTRNGSWDFYTN